MMILDSGLLFWATLYVLGLLQLRESRRSTQKAMHLNHS